MICMRAAQRFDLRMECHWVKYWKSKDRMVVTRELWRRSQWGNGDVTLLSHATMNSRQCTRWQVSRCWHLLEIDGRGDTRMGARADLPLEASRSIAAEDFPSNKRRVGGTKGGDPQDRDESVVRGVIGLDRLKPCLLPLSVRPYQEIANFHAAPSLAGSGKLLPNPNRAISRLMPAPYGGWLEKQSQGDLV